MTADLNTHAILRACSLDELQAAGVKVVATGDRMVALFWHEGRVYAVDNRCPHMGFPLSRGTVRDGILTCHWHHAKFDLAGGCTFDPFADDVAAYQVEVRDGLKLLGEIGGISDAAQIAVDAILDHIATAGDIGRDQ